MARVSVRIYPSGAVAGIVRSNVTRYTLPKVQRTANLARAYAPVDTGALRASIRIRARSAGGQFASAGGGTPIASWEIVAGGGRVNYAGYMEAGTAPHIIRARRARVLTDGVNFFGPVVHHPGTRARRYMARALIVGMR